jgi:putative transposase
VSFLWREQTAASDRETGFETGMELRARLTLWIGYYNARRPHSTLAGRTPDEAYRATGTMKLAA